MLLGSDERDVAVEAFRSEPRECFTRNEPLKMLHKCVHQVHEASCGPATLTLLASSTSYR
jgi:hypothetical protein